MSSFSAVNKWVYLCNFTQLHSTLYFLGMHAVFLRPFLRKVDAQIEFIRSQQMELSCNFLLYTLSVHTGFLLLALNELLRSQHTCLLLSTLGVHTVSLALYSRRTDCLSCSML